MAAGPQSITVSKPLDDRKDLLRLLLRLVIYYAVLIVAVAVLARLFPEVVEALPIGGVDVIAGQGNLTIERLDAEALDRITSSGAEQPQGLAVRLDDARDLLIAMTGVLLLMLPVAWVYRSTNYSGAHDHSLDETAFVLPVVVAGIVIVVQHSLALAFSLAGIVAGVRFRRALKDTYDALYILMAIGVGIAAGVKALEIAAVLSMFFNFTTVMVLAFGDGLESHHKRSVKLAAAREEGESAAESPTRES